MSEVEGIFQLCLQAVAGSIGQVLSSIVQTRQRKLRRKRRWWIKPWLKRRIIQGASNNLLRKLALEDPEEYRNHLRMTEDNFDELLFMVQDKICKQDTVMRESLSPKLKLQITLRYLATGDSLKSIQALYRVPKSTISQFVVPVCDAIFDALQEIIKVPTTKEEWQAIQKEFKNKWQFPNCCGAFDGKQISIKKPPNSATEYYNYKGTFSVVLFASVDANYCFNYIDVGAKGRVNDAAIFLKSTLNEALLTDMLDFHQNGVFLGDDAFPLKNYLLKTYSRCTELSVKGKHFNYRLCRARRVVENAFGIMVSRFRIFEKPIAVNVDRVNAIVKAACALHNWLQLQATHMYTPPCSLDSEDCITGELVPGSWRQQNKNNIINLAPTTSRNHSSAAKAKRDNDVNFVTSTGAVPFQWDRIHL